MSILIQEATRPGIVESTLAIQLLTTKMSCFLMTKLAIFWLLLLPFGALHAQDAFTAPWKSVKLYLNYDVFKTTGGFSNILSEGGPIGRLSPAFSWSKQPRFVHEIGIAALQFSGSRRTEVYLPLDSVVFNVEYIGGEATTDYQFALQYELAWKWLDWGSGAFYFGGSVTPFVSKTTFESDSPGVYDASEKMAGMHLQGVFRLLFRLGNRWFVDLNTPAGFMLNTSDRTITQNGNTQNSTTLDFGSVMGLRAGLGYRF